MRAIVLREDKQVAIEQCNVTDLPEGDVNRKSRLLNA